MSLAALPEAHQGTPAVRFRGLSKSFGHLRALSAVDLDIAPGSIHALVGQNGAGKSTLLGILAGRFSPSGGDVEIFGRPMPLGSPRAARALGVVAIYQELTIVPTLSACANVFLGQEKSSAGVLRESAMRGGFKELCSRLGASIAPQVEAGSLSVADQQILEIMRALQADARVLLLDEPTTALAPPEREALFRRMRELRRAGVTMILVSHNLDEVLEIADRVSVFRDGALIRTALIEEWSKAALVTAMLGHQPPPLTWKWRVSSEEIILRAENVSVPGRIEGVSFAIGRGEVLGIGGLVGSGRTTLLRALVGMEPRSSGRLLIDGSSIAWPRSPAAALALGIALVPEDRKGQAIFPQLSAQENIVVTDLPAVAQGGLISARNLRRQAAAIAREYGFDVDRLGTLAGTLSGGNQQKLTLARWQHRRLRILLADEPTRGIDVGAKEEILRKLRALAAEGLSIVLVSSELQEITDYSDRILILAGGRSAGELVAGSSVGDILHAAFAVNTAGRPARG